MDDSPALRTVRTRTVQHIVNVEALDTSWNPRLREEALARGFRSLVQAPMLPGDDVVGVIAVTRAQAQGFSPAEIALLQTFADQAVIAVENVRLFRELEGRNGDLTDALEQQTELELTDFHLPTALDNALILGPRAGGATDHHIADERR
jgi:GAF domain-containing protein